MHCGVHLPNQTRMVICRVASADLVRELGRFMYQNVMLSGEATWLRHNWHIKYFKITGFEPPKTGSIREALQRIYDAGGKAWDEVKNPDKFIRDMRGAVSVNASNLVVSIDSMTLVWGIRRQGTAEQLQRAAWLFEQLDNQNAQIILPAVVASEYLVPVDPGDHPAILAEMSKRFLIAPFDVRCASLAARLFVEGKGGINKGIANAHLFESGLSSDCHGCMPRSKAVFQWRQGKQGTSEKAHRAARPSNDA